MATTAEEIQAHMRQVRCELGEGVDDLVENARVMTDWRYYVHRYPWACVGAAAVVGFLLVPSRPQLVRPDPRAIADELAKRHLAMPAGEEPKAKHGVIAALAAMAGNAALQGGIAFAKSRLSDYLKSQLTAPSDGERVTTNGGAHQR